MPEMSGVDLCRAIRAEDMDAYVYVVLLTSHNGPHERVAGLRAGADDFVVKPSNLAELRARLAAGERVLSLETRDVAIFALAKLAESRDAGTGAHLERVRSYSRVLAQHLATTSRFEREIDAEQIRLVYQTSPLHDIGKVGIPDSVLLKPGRLTEAEFEVMKRHTSIGAHTLDAARQRFPEIKFLKMARDIAASHHERFDGSGYPEGLAGDEIPLAARIVAVADVYDALTSQRVYKDAYSHEVARQSILDLAGTQFDPDLVTAFVANERALEAIRARRPDEVPCPA
jgi:putative two-component system response regulator